MTCIIPIGGNKGGTGKSFIGGNLCVALARSGKKTLMVDLDLGASNLHTIIGMPLSSKCISDFVNRRVDSLEETVISTPVPGLFLISGGLNDLDAANISYQQKQRLVRSISQLSYDYIILDLGAGTSFNTVDFLLISNTGIFITIPEPTAIENFYRLIRSLFYRMMKHYAGASDFKTIVGVAREHNSEGHADSLDSLVVVFNDLFSEKAFFFEKALENVSFKLVMNQMRDSDNPKLGNLICQVIEKHQGIPVGFLGNIAYNSRVHDSVCSRDLFIDKYSYTQTTLDIRKLSEAIIVMDKGACEAVTKGGSSDKISRT
ncbi:MAG: AAA family ATPase [Thermodesulfobacteriota bacterium]|nr:AAA family ATPase [Thermodesulfobacteriota bacterium]